MTLAKVNYPTLFPCPSRGSYGMVVAAGLRRDPDTYPSPNQARPNQNELTVLSVAFAIPFSQLFRWQTWVNDYGYHWFNINLAHPFMSPGSLVEPVACKFTDSSLVFSYGVFGMVNVPANLELHPAVFAESSL